MAGLFGTIGNSTSIASSTAKKTILQMTAAAGSGLRIRGLEITFGGTSTTQAKILVEVEKAAGAGAGGSSVTPAKKQGHTGTIQATGKEGLSTVSTGTVVAKALVHPQGGFTFPDEIILNPSEVLSVNVTSTVDTTTLVRAQIEE